MKRVVLLYILMILFFLLSCTKQKNTSHVTESHKEESLYQQKAHHERIQTLLDQANSLSDQKKFTEALPHVRQLVELSTHLHDKPKFQYDMLDFQHFLLLKTGSFEEAVENGMALDILSHKMSERNNPWNCLKIADAYLGMRELNNALKWIEKAVYERNFTRLDVLDNKSYNALHEHPRFIKMITKIEERIGIGFPAHDFTITLIDGSPFTLSAQKGKVVLIDFWDVNCPPCRKALPHLKDLHKRFASEGLLILGISLDTDKTLLDVYLKQAVIPWQMACSLKGWADETAKRYNINSTPSTWLIDRKGILRHINLREEALTQAIEKLL